MLSCQAMCQLVEDNWAVVAPPLSGTLGVRLRKPGAAAAWARFFRSENMPLQHIILVATRCKDPAADVDALLDNMSRSCCGSLQRLTTVLPDSVRFRHEWLESFGSLRHLELALHCRQETIGMHMIGFDFRWATWQPL